MIKSIPIFTNIFIASLAAATIYLTSSEKSRIKNDVPAPPLFYSEIEKMRGVVGNDDVNKALEDGVLTMGEYNLIEEIYTLKLEVLNKEKVSE